VILIELPAWIDELLAAATATRLAAFASSLVCGATRAATCCGSTPGNARLSAWTSS
jgi:hypothetical protein